MLIPLLATTGCNPEKESVISAPSVEITDGMMSPEVLEAFGRVSEAVPSPDGKKIAFTVGYESIESNASNAEIYIMNADGSEVKQLTQTSKSESNIRWIENGSKIAFVCMDQNSGNPQMFTINPDGSERRRVSNLENGVSCF